MLTPDYLHEAGIYYRHIENSYCVHYTETAKRVYRYHNGELINATWIAIPLHQPYKWLMLVNHWNRAGESGWHYYTDTP